MWCGCCFDAKYLLKAHPVSEGNGKLAKVSGKLGDSGVQDAWVSFGLG